MGVFNSLKRFGISFGEAALGTRGPARHLNPLNQFNGEQLNKLKGMINQEKSGDDLWGMAQEYFKGKTARLESQAGKIVPKYDDVDPDTAKRLSKIRKIAAIGGGSLLAANALDIDPGGATSALTDVAMLGAHATAGKALWNMGGRYKLAGAGYLGLTTYNTLIDRGPSLGPM